MHPDLRNVTLHNIALSLISSNETLGNKCVHSESPSLLSHFLLIYHGFWHWNGPPKEFKPHACTHHGVIVVIIAMLTLCYIITSHATLPGGAVY